MRKFINQICYSILLFLTLLMDKLLDSSKTNHCLEATTDFFYDKVYRKIK